MRLGVRMPAISNASRWRQHPQETVAWIYLDTPPVVFSAQVNGNIASFPVRVIQYDNVSFGVYTSCERFQEVLFGSAPGLDDLGRTYLRLNPDSQSIWIPRCSQGNQVDEINVVDDSYITVIDQFSLHSRKPWIADGIEMADGAVVPPLGSEFVDTNIDPSAGVTGYPWINLGGGPIWIGYVDTLTNLITVTLSPLLMSKPYGGSAITTWLWDIKDGSYVTGSNSSANIKATFPVGRRVIKVTGTDNLGHPTTRHLLVVACKDGTAYEPIKFFTAKLGNSTLSGGHQLDATIYDDISAKPNGCYMALWVDESYNGVHGSLNVCSDIIGQTGFENIWFSGWHWQNPFNVAADDKATLSEVTISGLDTVGMMDIAPGFIQEVNRVTNPTTWVQMKNAAMWLYEQKLAYYFTTAPFCGMDFYDDEQGDNFGFQRLGSGETTIYKQISELTDRAIGYTFNCNQQNMAMVRANPQLLDSTNRTSTVIVALDEGDIQSMDSVGTWFPDSYWDHGAAILASQVDVDTAPIMTAFAVAPGLAPGVGPAKSDLNEQLAIDAAELLRRTGKRRANTGTAPYKSFNLKLVHNGNAGIEACYGQWITITFTTMNLPTQRPIVFNNSRFRVLQSTITITADNKGTVVDRTYQVELETDGIDAAFDPQPANPNPPPALPPSPTPPPVSTQTGLQTGGTAWAWDDSGHFAFTYNFSAGSNWTSCIGTGLTGQIWMVRFDPYSPWWNSPSTSTPMYAYVATTTGLFYGNCNSASPVWVQQQAATTFAFGYPNQIRPNSSLPGELCWSYFDSGGNSHIKWLNNYGAGTPVWAISPAWNGVRFGLDIDQYGSRTAYVGGRDGSGVNGVWRVINGGAPQPMYGPGPVGSYFDFIQKPLLTFSGAPNNQVGAGTTECLLINYSYIQTGTPVTQNGGNSWVDIAPGVVSGFNPSVDVLATSAMATDNANVVTVQQPSQIYTTINKGGLWTPKSLVAAYNSQGIIKFPGDANYSICGGYAHNVFLSKDFGATAVNFFGDWATSQGSGNLVAILPASNTSHG